MDSTRIAALFSVLLATLAMVINFTALPMLFNRMSKIQFKIQAKMDNFKVGADHAWMEMMSIRQFYVGRMQREASDDFDTAAVPFPHGYDPPKELFSQKSRVGVTPVASLSLTTMARISIQTDPPNSCPPGPPGRMGEPGQDGMPGSPGPDGQPGTNAAEVKLLDEEMCTMCPHGPVGPMGATGPQGLKGKKGLKGEVGKKGFDGDIGKLGPAGFRGISGIDGKNGTKGIPGKPAPGGKGEKGPKGARGPIGRSGPQGETGKPNFANLGVGILGVTGKVGLNGTAGKSGPKGPSGVAGVVGLEGGFCPCPKELNKLGGADGKNKDTSDKAKDSDDDKPHAVSPSSNQLPTDSTNQVINLLDTAKGTNSLGGGGGGNEATNGKGTNNVVTH